MSGYGDHLRHVADLEWFFNERRGDLGYKAQNYDPDRWKGDSHDPDRYGVTRAAATAREWRIGLALYSLTHEQLRTIEVAYAEHRYRGLERWGREAGVAARLFNAENKEGAGLTLAAMLTQPESRAEAEALRRRAETALRGAMRAYVDATLVVSAEMAEERRRKVERDRRQAEAMGRRFVAPVEEE